MQHVNQLEYDSERIKRNQCRSLWGWCLDTALVALPFVPYLVQVVFAVNIYLGGGTWLELQEANRQAKYLLMIAGLIFLLITSTEIVMGRSIGMFASQITCRAPFAVLKIRLPWLLALSFVALAAQANLYIWDGRRVLGYAAWASVGIACVVEIISFLSLMGAAKNRDKPTLRNMSS